jgi:hypothetical protein
VLIALQANTISVTDGTTQTKPKQIQFNDLVGQPTYSQPYTVQCTCVMRYDIGVGDYVTLPLALGTIQSGSNSQFFNVAPGNIYSTQKSSGIFSGTFLVVAVRHVGNSRGPDATAWVTTLDMILQSPPENVVDKLPPLYTGKSPTSGG